MDALSAKITAAHKRLSSGQIYGWTDGVGGMLPMVAEEGQGFHYLVHTTLIDVRGIDDDFNGFYLMMAVFHCYSMTTRDKTVVRVPKVQQFLAIIVLPFMACSLSRRAQKQSTSKDILPD